MELVTSLRLLKMAMNNGVLPPMTPITDVNVLAVIDPVLTIGLGALREDELLGLQCPIRGCGKWFQNLGAHVTATHRSVGADGLRRALDIPHTAPLASLRFSQSHSRAALRRIADGSFIPPIGQARTKSGHRKRKTGATGIRNLQNACRAQLAHKIIDLSNKLGRAPSAEEFTDAHPTLMYHVARVFGSWSNAKENCGLESYRANNRHGAESRLVRVLAALSAWHDAHGSLPRSTDATMRSTPLLPEYKTILRAFSADAWGDAMRRAASMLNIYGGRYGLPEKKAG